MKNNMDTIMKDTQWKSCKKNQYKSNGSTYLSCIMQHLRQVFISPSAGRTLRVTACIPIGKLSKQQLTAAIAEFISTRQPSEVINLVSCADRHTAISAWASSGSVMKILVQTEVSALQ
jgi:hypothetical protein